MNLLLEVDHRLQPRADLERVERAAVEPHLYGVVPGQVNPVVMTSRDRVTAGGDPAQVVVLPSAFRHQAEPDFLGGLGPREEVPQVLVARLWNLPHVQVNVEAADRRDLGPPRPELVYQLLGVVDDVLALPHQLELPGAAGIEAAVVVGLERQGSLEVAVAAEDHFDLDPDVRGSGAGFGSSGVVQLGVSVRAVIAAEPVPAVGGFEASLVLAFLDHDSRLLC